MTIKIFDRTSVLWAKKRTEDGHQSWLPLIVHLIDTQNTINYLLTNWLSPEQQRLLTGRLSEEETQRLVKFVGFIHDIGKGTAAFQVKKSSDHDDSLDEDLSSRLAQGGFRGLDEVVLASASQSPHALAGEAIIEGMGVPESIGAIIGGHHGKPAKEAPENQIDDYTANFYQDDIDPKVQKPWKAVQKELFKYGLTTSGYQEVADIPDITQPQAVVLEGLLIMADWLASSEYLDYQQEKPLFPLIPLNQSYQDIDIGSRFRRAMGNWSVGGEWQPQRIELNDLDQVYMDRWKFKPRPVQRSMSQAIGKALDPGMVIVEAPMGLGKTEIALLAVEQLAYMTGSDGLFMGLPTQATTNAMFNRVNKWLNFLADFQDENFEIKLMHSKAQFNKTYRSLPDASNVYGEADDHGDVVVNGWFSGKKSILSKFTVGTIDNLLLMGLKQKHLFLRHLGFSGKVVVIDEVHAYDAYMNQYLYKAVNWLGAYHVPIVILSATLPKAKRNALLEAYLLGKYGKKYVRKLVAPKGWEETQAYPLLSILDGSQIKQTTTFPGKSDQQPAHIQVKRLDLPDEDLIDHAVHKISDGGVAGIIVNTVKRAQKLAQLVPPDIQLMVMHSAFLANDRSVQETKIQDAIGKHGNRPEKMIVIGTQVLEQSLDIDFDIMYTDIAPMDLILQRAGRLHRHQIERPAALRSPQLFVMGIEGTNEYEAGSTFVYGQYLLMKTDHFLKNEITLPDDISPLVQEVYDPKTDSEITDIAEAKADFAAKFEKEEKKAHVFQVGEPKLKAGKTIHGWLSRDLGNIGNDEQQASAAVRDIKETLEVILVQHTEEGNFLLDGRSLADVQSKEIAQQIIRLPFVITPNPDKVDQAIKDLETLTSRYFSGWQSDVWLKGSLVLPLDQDFSVTFEGWRLTYSSKLGLKYVQEDDNRGR